MSKILCLCMVFFAAMLLFAGCIPGGNPAGSPEPTLTPVPTSTPTPTPVTTVFYSEPAMDGYYMGNFRYTEDTIKIGDYRRWVAGPPEIGGGFFVTELLEGYVSFNLDALMPPTGKSLVVQSARLDMHQTGTVGTPYSIGPVKVDLVSYTDNTLYDLSDIQQDIGTLSTDETLGVKSLYVTEAVNQVTGTDGSFRLQFQLSHDHNTGFASQEDQSLWVSGDGTTDVPQLAVVYYFEEE